MLSEDKLTTLNRMKSDLCDHDLCEPDLCEPLCLVELPVTPLDLGPRPSLEGLLGPPRPFLEGLLGLRLRSRQACSLVEREEEQVKTDHRREQQVGLFDKEDFGIFFDWQNKIIFVCT